MKKAAKNISLAQARTIRMKFRLLSAATIVTLIVGVFMMRYLEGLSYLDALYFSVVSLTTVGYGDFTAVTVGGKIFVMGYLIVGIGIIAAFVSILLKNAIAYKVIQNNQGSRNVKDSK